VITPNVTGSTGYGQAFTDAIRKDWGGAPYNDLVNVMDWVEEHMPEVDMTRAVALGASYGGYMVNWLNGHDLGRRFKALVCHDGIFSFAGGLLYNITNTDTPGPGWHTMVLYIEEPDHR
jgi:dipeptidyl aminopeptidase/acylaminoacyl peptidase